MVVVGLAFLVLRVWLIRRGIGGDSYCGMVSIPFFMYAFYELVPANVWPQWLVSCSFAVFLIHRFVLYLVCKLIDPGQGVVIYIAVSVVAFVGSLVVANIMKRYFPNVASFAFGGR